MKTCNKCKKDKQLAEFDKNLECKFGVSGICKECKNTRLRERNRLHPEWRKNWRKKSYEKNKNKAKEQYLLYHYGIDLTEFNVLLEKQNNLCAICKKPESSVHQSGILKKLSVDHDHKTGKIRGLLCYNCNRGIGHLQDNLEILNNAIAYLEKNNEYKS